ncbi:MAG: hypothetical protein GXO79_15340 [Chlorobi bacterium]|nr:hypothetical protein [Chlorobiota bacterium]
MNRFLIYNLFFSFIFSVFFYGKINGQPVPSLEENIDFLVTFSRDASATWGDDDHIQIHFLAIPKDYKGNVFISIFDPDIGGKYDQLNGSKFDSFTKFSLYGGEGAYSNEDARNINPKGNYNSGIQLGSKKFGVSTIYDDQWFTFGPINPKEGEFDKALNAYVFKIIAEGLKGNDGNMYRYYISSSDLEFNPIEGMNCFTYEMSFRLKNIKNTVAHFYPFLDSNIIAIKQHNYDYDSEGQIRLTTVIKKSHQMSRSGDGNWATSTHEITPDEQNTTIDIQIISSGKFPNDMVFYLTNQYGKFVPFYSVPIGGVPKYRYKVDIIYAF